MEKSHLKLVAPLVNRTKRPPNKALRTREYLTEAEAQRLMEAAKANRRGHRDATMVLLDLRWDQVNFQTATPAVRRVKKGAADPSCQVVL